MSNRTWAAAAASFALAGCGAHSTPATENLEVIEPEPTAVPAAPAAPRSPWTYTTSLDPMTDRPTHMACSTSTNVVRLQWPDSQVAARLCIRQSPQHGLDAYVALPGGGQVVCGFDNDCTVKVRFGESDQQSFSGGNASDGSGQRIFLTNAQRFVTGVKDAPITRIKVTLYQAGDQVLEFKTADLEWPVRQRSPTNQPIAISLVTRRL